MQVAVCGAGLGSGQKLSATMDDPVTASLVQTTVPFAMVPFSIPQPPGQDGADPLDLPCIATGHPPAAAISEHNQRAGGPMRCFNASPAARTTHQCTQIRTNGTSSVRGLEKESVVEPAASALAASLGLGVGALVE